jgi:Plasmid pRiA4b ORF-3-like protein
MVRSTAQARLIEVGTKTLRYLYDFGDGRKHTIKVEHHLNPQQGVIYPRIIEATGRLRQFLHGAIHDTTHERYVELTEWIACSFDPNMVDIAQFAEQPTKSPRWRNPGLTVLRRGALHPPKPRRSPDGYKETVHQQAERLGCAPTMRPPTV